MTFFIFVFMSLITNIVYIMLLQMRKLAIVSGFLVTLVSQSKPLCTSRVSLASPRPTVRFILKLDIISVGSCGCYIVLGDGCVLLS